MESILFGLHIFICIFLIAVIMLQTGKGADIGAVFGGASHALFGGRGPATFLNKLTIGVSILFFLTSIGLATWGDGVGTKSVIETVPVEEILPPVAPSTETPAVPVKTPKPEKKPLPPGAQSK
ncbi:MAG: preprotein translocase subunit SecG [Deltaproteobacteria bacterium]|nr:preprotein translocase subunit SecG [Deltaproteobacteria bacterium]